MRYYLLPENWDLSLEIDKELPIYFCTDSWYTFTRQYFN